MTSLELISSESDTIINQILLNNEIGKNHFVSYESVPNVIRMEDLTKSESHEEPIVSYQNVFQPFNWSTEKTVHSPTPEEEWQSKFGARHQIDKNKKHFIRKDDPLSGAWLNTTS